MSEASTVAVATGDVSGDVRVAALSCDALGTGYDAADPLNVERRARSEETMANADLLLDQGTAQAPRAHQGAVTAVYLVRDPLDARVVISCGVDAKVRVWAFGQAEDTFSLTLARQLSTGEHTPTSICPLKRTEMLLAVGHAEGLVSVWAVDEDEPSLRSLCDDGGRRVVRLEARESNVVATDDQGSIMSFGLEKGGSLVPMGSMKGEAPYLALRGLAEAGGPTAVAADGALLQPFAPPRAPPPEAEDVFERLSRPTTPRRSRSPSSTSRSPRRYASPPRSPPPPALFEAEAPASPRGLASPSARRPPAAATPPRRPAASPRTSLSPRRAPPRPRRRGDGGAAGGGLAAGGRPAAAAAVREPAAVLVRAPVAVAGGRAARPGADAGRGACAAQKPRALSAPAARQPAAVRMRLGLRACTAAGRRPHARRFARRGGRRAGAGPRHEAKGGRGRGQSPGPRLRRCPVPAPAGLRGAREPGARRPRRPTS